MINQIKQSLEQTIYGYEPSEFLPVTVDGEIANWDAFAVYKAKRVASHLGEFSRKTVEATAAVAVGFGRAALL